MELKKMESKNMKNIKENCVHIYYGMYNALICVIIMYLVTFILLRPFSIIISISNFDYIFGGVCFIIISIGLFWKNKYSKYNAKVYSFIVAIIVIFLLTFFLTHYISIIYFSANFFLPIILLLLMFLVIFIAYKKNKLLYK